MKDGLSGRPLDGSCTVSDAGGHSLLRGKEHQSGGFKIGHRHGFGEGVTILAKKRRHQS
jgi:hypothetical protein